MIEWAPAVMALPGSVHCACALPPDPESTTPVQSWVTPSLKDTVPVGVNPDEPSATVAV